MIAFTRMLDTNIVSDLVRNPGGKAAQRLALEGEDAVCVSIIAAAELRFGVAKRESQRLATQLGRVLATMTIMPFEAPADAVYGLVRTGLELAWNPDQRQQSAHRSPCARPAAYAGDAQHR